MNIPFNIKNKVLLLFLILVLLTKITNGQNTNTTCATAINVVTNGACAPAVTVTDASNNGNLNVCGSAVLREAWYTFTATGTTATIVATANNRNVAIELLDGCGGAVLGCDNTTNVNSTDTETLTASGLTNGNIYVVRIVNVGTNDLNFTSLCITGPVVAPANDDCAGATAFPAIPIDGTCSNLTNQTTAGSTNSGVTPSGACSSNSGTPDDDVWFSFIATSTTQTLTATWVSGNTDVYWQVFSGACGASMTALLCTDVNAGGNITGLTIGQTYYIRLYTWSSSVSTVQDICLAGVPPPAAPANDNCAGATAFPAIPVNGTCSNLTNQTTAGSTNSGVTPSGACTSNSGTSSNDVWFSFIATSTTQTLTATWVSGLTDVYWQVFSGACGASMNALLCTDVNAGGTITGLTIGQTYYIRLYAYFTGTTVQNICLAGTPPPAPPSNDDCGGAISLTVNSGTTCTTSTGGTLLGATTSTQTNSCAGGSADDDVWYKFTATASTHSVSITNIAGSVTDMYHSVYGGTCGAIGSPLVCSDPNSSVVSGLTIGSVYYIRIFSYTSTGSQNTTFSVCVTTPPPPPTNDNCSSASAFPVIPTDGTCSTLNNQTTANATASGVTPSGACTSNSGTPSNDVWFSFIATSTTQTLTATWVSGETDVYWQVFSGACGTSMNALVCTDVNAGGTLTSLTIGQTYYIRLYAYFAGTTVQNICITGVPPPPPPANDNCTGATTLTVNPGATCTASSGGTLLGATTSTNANTCFGTADDDVWYQFTATATSHSVSITNVAGSVTDMYHSVYAGTCGSIGLPLICSDPNLSLITGLTIGNVYYVRVYSYTSTGGQNTTFSVCVLSPPPPPANDDCAGAVNVTVNGGTTCTSQANGTVLGATASSYTNACSGTADDDVWYKFTATSSTHSIGITNVAGSVTDMYHSLYAGTCAAMGAPLICSDPNSSAISGLTIGSVYYIRVFSYTSTGGQTTTFSVCVTTPAAGPANDNCSGSTVVTVNSGTVCTSQAGGTLVNAYASTVPNDCSGTADDDVWYKFVATATTHSISVNNIASTPTDLYHSVYTGTCGTLGSALVCSDPNSSVITGLTIGTTYFVRVFSYTSGTGSTTTFSLCVSTPTMPPAPANDDCPGAYPVTVNSGTTCTSLTGGTLVGATASTPTNSCGGTIDDDDVWYSFVATAAYHQITLSNIAGSTTDLYHSVFAGTCGAIGAALTCSDPNSSAVNGLTIGATYYIRIYSAGSTWGATTTFSVCITTPPPPPVNTSCSGMEPICSGSTINFTAESNGATAAPGPNYGCLSTRPNPTWFFMEILTSGTMAVDISAGSDIDFALWGPYTDLAAAKADCSAYPTPIDCSYSTSAIEQANIASAVVGEVYALLVTNYANTVQNITLNQAAGANATTNCAIILPVGLLYFNATPDENIVNISWETASELNNDYFEIERSIDGEKWEVLTRKDGMGTIHTKTNYKSIDDKPYSGVSYYRLKQVDFNQTFIYSNIVSVDLSIGIEQVTNVHPNPTKGNIEFEVISKTKNQILIELIDNTGNIVSTQQNVTDEGSNSIKLNLEKFDSGIYLLKVSFENTGKSVIQKVIKH